MEKTEFTIYPSKLRWFCFFPVVWPNRQCFLGQLRSLRNYQTEKKQCSANTSHVDLKTTHSTNIARVGRWMVKIWSFSFLSLKLKIKQFRELGMTCEWMRWHWNYEVKSLSFRVAMSVLSILPHFEHWEFINPPFLIRPPLPLGLGILKKRCPLE